MSQRLSSRALKRKKPHRRGRHWTVSVVTDLLTGYSKSVVLRCNCRLPYAPGCHNSVRAARRDAALRTLGAP